MLTKKGKYGLKAMIHLANRPSGETALVADIATANAIPKKFLDAILGELRTAGFLHSKKGRGGGYRLSRPAEDILVGELIRTLDGSLAPIACASRSAYQRCDDCPDENACATRLLMVQVGDAIAGVVDALSLAELRDLVRDPFDSFVYHI
ncbi:RrF2 family transcriptional regulator [Phreatobacter stygius]|uniref:Rrf2 family transcriptional regulator n=1 Tax=Phreatobacter stygius TaxID=1940610 RepID=A0A4D7B0N2_9HYPH|nr:Rrf2 family transcriptional regulator [Phreatobacter stygius]QCI66291.1 Rrf2 family transcriptional regulator [Phreatobacter stygius]